MCGIFGYIGPREDSAAITFEGLKILEYRGYDSWGISISNGKDIEFEKHIGKIGDSKINLPKANSAIGHTRWATHGKVTYTNAHPHLSCGKEISVIHNGIIENYQELKESLGKNHKYVSETDTELVSHMIEEEIKESNLLDAVKNVFKKLNGLNAIVVQDRKGEIVAAKKGSSLVIGIGKNEYFLASDPTAILKHTKKAVFLEDNQLVKLNSDGVKFFDLKSDEEISPEIQKLDWEIEESHLGKYKHFMLKEINEQPVVVANIAKNYKDQINDISSLIKKAKGTFFIGCGTASYAALTGQYLFSSIAKRHVNFSIGSEFNYLEHYLTPESLVIAISQSGETIDVVEPVNNAKKKGSRIVALTNVLGSTLYRKSDNKLLLGAGPEVAVCATKSFVAMVSVLIYLSYEINGKGKEASRLLLKASSNIHEILKENYQKKIKKLAKEISSKDIYLLGRGISYPIALEGALKLKEVTYSHSEGFAGGELKHGVIALIEKGTPVVVFAPLDETYDSIISNAVEVKARGGYIIGISPRENEAFDYWLPVNEDLKEATILPNIVIIQLLSYFISIEKKLDPDKPRNLAKSVTVK